MKKRWLLIPLLCTLLSTLLSFNVFANENINVPSLIYGQDSRLPVPNNLISPYKEVTYLEMTFPDGQVFKASGVMIAPNKVLTVAHAVVNGKTGQIASNITVYPAIVANSNSLPFESASGSNYHILSGYISTGFFGYTNTHVNND